MIWRAVFFCTMFGLSYLGVNLEAAWNGDSVVVDSETSPAPLDSPVSQRHLLNTSSSSSGGCKDDTSEKFPKRLKDGDEWQVALWLLLVLYMFLALAIVCDEYFVASLEVICSEDMLNLGDDVAGATFMAAGGSAPELFTSFIGTFQDSAVGFGTIIGSAVFNVLFVIAVCVMASKEVLELTWWPLFRDSMYYSLSLGVLALFFSGISDGEIEWWEAAILLSMYFGYVTLMAFNQNIYGAIMERYLGKEGWEEERKRLEQEEDPSFVRPSLFRAGVVSLLTSDKDLATTTGVHVVAKIKGDVYMTFGEVDSDGDGMISNADLHALFQKMEITVNDEDLTKLQDELDINKNGFISREDFASWYAKSEARLDKEMEECFKMYDQDNNGFIDSSELEAMMIKLSLLPISKKDVEEAMSELDTNKDQKISWEEFSAWYRTSLYFREAKFQAQEMEDETGDPLEWPAEGGCRSKSLYILCLPLNLVLAYTVPNAAAPGETFGISNHKWCWYSFVASIMWIGVFSFFMVTGAEICGDTAGIPASIMGLTFLAAGTSVPDLLSSVVVAIKGKGDMAVSSSIGSNIFDVLIGLPLPWLAYNAVYAKSVCVQAESLGDSILILMAMLLAVVLIVKLNDWKMTKSLGIAMFILYILFMAQSLLRDKELICSGGCF